METVRVQTLPIRPGEILLDLGCGEGRHSIAADFYFPEATVIGLDLNGGALAQAQKKHLDFNPEHSNCFYFRASGFQLPLKNKGIDHIICSEVLEHITDYLQVITEIKRVLKPGGTLTVSVPRAWPEKICWMLSDAYYKVEGGHVQIFQKKKLAAEIIDQGFYKNSSHYAHALHSIYWWLRCARWNSGQENALSKVYHKLLVWDLIKKPMLTQWLEKWLNPICGKSVVLYFTHGAVAEDKLGPVNTNLIAPVVPKTRQFRREKRSLVIPNERRATPNDEF